MTIPKAIRDRMHLKVGDRLRFVVEADGSDTARARMIGIDTNVVIRLLVADDEKQADAAVRYLKAHCSEDPALLSDIVLVECAWVLEDVYEYSRAQIGEAIDGLLATAQLRAATAFGVGLALDLILVVLLAVGEAVVLLFPKRIYNGVNIGQIGFFETLQANEGRIPYIIVRPGRRAPWDAHAMRARHPNCPNLDFSRSELQAMLQAVFVRGRVPKSNPRADA